MLDDYQYISDSIVHMLNNTPGCVGDAILTSILCLHVKDCGRSKQEFLEIMDAAYDLVKPLHDTA